MDQSQNGQSLEWTKVRMDKGQSGQRLEWTKVRVDRGQNGLQICSLKQEDSDRHKTFLSEEVFP